MPDTYNADSANPLEGIDQFSASYKLAQQFVVYTPEPGYSKKRIGPKADGGYVLLNHSLDQINVLYSYGVGGDYRFEQDMFASYGCIGRLFDPTVEFPYEIDEGLFFKKIGLATNQGSILHHIEDYNDLGKRMILKIDTEGAEWKWLEQTNAEELCLFDQIIIEFHELGNCKRHLEYSELLSRLNAYYYLIHVHGNNQKPLVLCDALVMPDVMECSFIRKDLCSASLNTINRFPLPGFDCPSDETEFAPLEWKLNYWPFISNQDPAIERLALSEAHENFLNFKKIKKLEFMLSNLKSSGSWKLTAPIRGFCSLIQSVRLYLGRYLPV